MDADINQIESDANARLGAAVDLHSAQSAQFSALLHREVWQAPAAPSQYLDRVRHMQEWLNYYDKFSETARWLEARGRPVFGVRLKLVVADSQRALGMMRDAAVAAGVHNQALLGIQVATAAAITQSTQKMTEDMKKAFDQANAKWSSYFKQ